MKRTSLVMLAIAALSPLLIGPGCIVEDRVIEVVLTGETCGEFHENHESEEYTTPVWIDYAGLVDEILADNDLDRSDIASAKVMSASYKVTEFDHGDDWTISGYITARLVGSGGDAESIIAYTDQSLLAAMPEPVPADLDEDGVAVVNQALQAYLDGGSPGLEFEVRNGSVTPPPSAADPLVFTWEACIKIHILYREEVEVPDPL
jgi:hypothetical protein